jgi:hypothetical protein
MRLSPYVLPVILGLAATAAIPSVPAFAQIGIGISVGFAPPALPIYVQPPIPEPGFLWTPGYWGYEAAGGYFWVPGTWVHPPRIGVLWTPPYWGFAGGVYGFHTGYWGPHVGFYGGINYGFGYGGVGFAGGRWEGGGFRYNSAVNNFGGTHITNVYREEVHNTTINRTSFNGGAGGVQARASAEEEAAAREEHVQATEEQTRNHEAAKADPQFRASANHGQPAVAATAKPGEFKGAAVVPAKAEEKPGEAGKPDAGAKAGAHAKAGARAKAGEDAGAKADAKTHAPKTPGAAHRAAAAHPDGEAKHAAPHPAAHTAAAPHPAPPPHQAAHPAPAHQGGGKKDDKK